jgi:two-component system, sensor histidine kinase PdtaS
MSILASAHKVLFQFPLPRVNRRDMRRHNELTAELQAALAREEVWLQEKRDLSQQQLLLAQEFEHRLVNGLQLISALLLLQSRTTTPEAAAQLTIAARRVASFGRVHRRLHLLDHQNSVEFKEYLKQLCDDLSGLLFQQGTDRAIVVEGVNREIPTGLGIPLGLIVNELITNAAKYTTGNIIVRFETTSASNHSLSVLDNGPGLPAGFDSAASKGIGMKIINSLAKQIDGELRIVPGDNGCGTRFTVTFCAPGSGPKATQFVQ